MRVTELTDAAPAARALAVGTFDGVHIGHRAVIGDADTVVTFEPHPSSVVAPAHRPRLLTPFPVKRDLIASLGVSELIIIRFDAAFAAHSAREFVDEVLVAALGAREVSIGENFRFGAGAQGDAEMLAADRRFATRVVPLRELDGEIVSSSRIRSLIAAGEVGRAAALLGDPFELRGEVVAGDRRGRTLGFPTANLVPAEGVACPGHGVYACLANGIAAAVVDRGSPDVRRGPPRADRGVPDRFRRRPLRHRAAPALPRAPARGAPFRDRRARSSRRCTTTSRVLARSPLLAFAAVHEPYQRTQTRAHRAVRRE